MKSLIVGLVAVVSMSVCSSDVIVCKIGKVGYSDEAGVGFVTLKEKKIKVNDLGIDSFSVNVETSKGEDEVRLEINTSPATTADAFIAASIESKFAGESRYVVSKVDHFGIKYSSRLSGFSESLNPKKFNIISQYLFECDF